MIEVIRSKRIKVAFFTGECSETVEGIYDFVKQRFTAELHVGRSVKEIQSIMEWCDVAWFDGCDEAAVRVCASGASCRIVVSVHNDDVYEGRVKAVDWGNVDVVILGSNSFVKNAFIDSVGDIGGYSRLVTMDYGIDLDKIEFRHRDRGKNIACVCDLNLRNNPMFLLQCMQKLNYLDSAYRLYITGRFADKATEQYLNHMVRTLGLSEVVMFEGRVDDLSEWFSDKHYIVWTGIGEEGVDGVFKGMASGLKPVVHNFPGSLELLNSQFLFNLSEDFCNQVLSDNYEPERYRDFVAARYGNDKRNGCINDTLIQLEEEIAAERPEFITEEPKEEFEGGICEMPADEFAGGDRLVKSVEVQDVSSDGVGQSGRKIIPIKPLGSEHIQATPVNSHEVDCSYAEPIAIESTGSEPIQKSGYSIVQEKGIDEVAAEALKASRALSEMIDQYTGEKPACVDKTSDADFGNGGYAATSPEIAAAQEKLNRMVSEFCDDK